MMTYAQAVNVSEPRGTEVTSAAVEARFAVIHGRPDLVNHGERTVKDTWVIDVQVNEYPSSLKSRVFGDTCREYSIMPSQECVLNR